MEKIAYGGVSARPCRGVVRGGRATVPATGPGRYPGFAYHGGPVLTNPQVYTSYWGTMWSDVAHQVRSERLDLFIGDLLRNGFMNVLSQYGVGMGRFAGRGLTAECAGVLTDGDVRAMIQQQIDAGALPEPISPSNIALLIYLDERINIQDAVVTLCAPTSDCAFGYHSFFITAAGNPFHYAVIPAITDICVRHACPIDEDGSLSLSQTQEQRQTQVTSHELAELVSNPQLSAWFDPHPRHGETGDICNGVSAQIVSGDNVWTIQRIYSKQDDIRTDGVLCCVAEAPAPLPCLSRKASEGVATT